MSPAERKIRAKKRTLVRWDESLDELLLLTVQSVCNTQSVKIPWAEVAKTMGHNTTEGAIVQHLAKLRARRLAAGKDVPPPLKRGFTWVASKPGIPEEERRQNGNGNAGTGDQDKAATTSSDENGVESSTFPKKKMKAQGKNARLKNSESISLPIKSESNLDGAESDSTSTSCDETHVPGAKVLELPGNNAAKKRTFSRQPTWKVQKRKIVVLKYRKPNNGALNAPLSPFEESPVTQTRAGINDDVFPQELSRFRFSSKIPQATDGIEFIDHTAAHNPADPGCICRDSIMGGDMGPPGPSAGDILSTKFMTSQPIMEHLAYLNPVDNIDTSMSMDFTSDALHFTQSLLNESHQESVYDNAAPPANPFFSFTTLEDRP